MINSNHEIRKQNKYHRGLLINFIQAYLDHYRDISFANWQRIILAFMNDMASGVIFFLSVYFVDILHMSIAKAGLLLSSYGVGKAIGGAVGGKLTDILSPNLVIISCLLIESLMFVALIKIHALILLIIIEFILGVAVYAFTTANKVCVLHSIKGNEHIKLKILSVLYTASNLGIGISAIYVSLTAKFGFYYIFLSASILLIASAAIFFIQTLRIQPDVYRFPTLLHENKPEGLDDSKNINPIVSWLILICVFSISLIIAQFSSTYSIYLTTSFPTLGVKAVSIVFALNSFLIIFLQTPVVNYFNKSNKILMVGIGAFLMAGSISLLSGAYTFLIVIISMISYTMGEMIFFSMAQLVVYQHSSHRYKGQGIGLFQTFLALGMIVGPSLGGYIYDRLGSHTLWYCCGLTGIVWLLVALHYKKYDLNEQS